MEEFLRSELIASVTVYQVVVIIHLFGLALGAGAAFFSDFLFTHIMKKGAISKDNFSVLKITSRVVWLGLTLLIASGLVLFLGNTETLLESTKFLAKITIVSLLTINGILFHFKHIPILEIFVDKALRSTSFKKMSTGLFMSGALSGVSWAAALILGSLNFVDMSYFMIMGIYLVVVVIAIISSLAIKKIILR